MKHRYLKKFFSVFLVVGSGWPICYGAENFSRSEKNYVENLARDTYACISYYVDSESGLPLDNSKHLKDAQTSVTNIGFYMASVVGGVELGVEKRSNAVKKLKKLFSTLQKLPKWKNFPHSWNHVTKLEKHPENFVSTVDLGNYYAGIITVRQYFPELRKECDAELAVNWNDLYDSQRRLLYGGYNTEKNEYGSWHYDYFGSDARLASFLSIAMSHLPMASWNELDRKLEERYGIEYFKPGWQGGGLFMLYMSGLFIDEEGSLPWLAAGNMTKANMIHKEKIKSPVWGWSASDSPSYGYCGYNAIRDDIITPHATALAISIFPKESIQNLQKLEDLGVRQPFVINGKKYNFGFRDAYNFKSQEVTENYLILDQTMFFLSLTNFLKDKLINRLFESYEPVRSALPKFKEYSNGIPKDQVNFPVNLSRKFNLVSIPFEVSQPKYQVIPAEFSVVTDFRGWDKAEQVSISAVNTEVGNVENEQDISANVSFLWDKNYLYLNCDVTDQLIMIHPVPSEIYKKDSIEIYVNPDGRGLVWGNPKDFQIGITPPDANGSFYQYAWFQKRETKEGEMKVVSRKTSKGYQVIAAISWKFLGVAQPEKGRNIGCSVAINDSDDNHFGFTKLNWYFKSDNGKIKMANLTLE